MKKRVRRWFCDILAFVTSIAIICGALVAYIDYKRAKVGISVYIQPED